VILVATASTQLITRIIWYLAEYKDASHDSLDNIDHLSCVMLFIAGGI